MIKYNTRMIIWANQDLSSFLKGIKLLGEKKTKWRPFFPFQIKIFRKQNN